MPATARIACLAALVAIAVAPGVAEARATPRSDLALGRRLATHFWELTHNQDRAGLDRFLSPAFQVQRFDGSGARKRSFVTNVGRTVSLADYRLYGFTVTRAGDTLVARFTAVTSEVIDTVLYSSAPSPRLETFVREDGRWRITSNANFNPPASQPADGTTQRAPLI